MTKHEQSVRLSGRLGALADMVPQGCTVVDVGCDHGFLDIFLIQAGRAEHALAMDVRKGPLAAATEHVKEWGLEGQIETRLSDGLQEFMIGEATVLVCAGMGGPLMQRILSAYPEKTASFREMILQPQSEIKEFREFLRLNGYRIIQEKILFDEGKYYFPIKVCPPQGRTEDAEQHAFSSEDDDWEMQQIFDRYGRGLIHSGDPLLLSYLREQVRINRAIRDELSPVLAEETDQQTLSTDRRLQRLREIEEELGFLETAIALAQGERE